MSKLTTDIARFTDGNQLVAPHSVHYGVTQGSDNGPMYTSEFFIAMVRNGENRHNSAIQFTEVLDPCIQNGILARAPRPQDSDPVGPDNILGFLAACTELQLGIEARGMLKALVRNYGFLPTGPKKRWADFYARQPQLLAAMLAAGNCASIFTGPLFVWTALVILLAGRKAPADEADPWRLSWLLIQTTAPVSFVCYLAAKNWRRRLLKTHPRGMRDVNAVYYEPGHPLIDAVKDEPIGGFGIPLRSAVYTIILIGLLVGHFIKG